MSCYLLYYLCLIYLNFLPIHCLFLGMNHNEISPKKFILDKLNAAMKRTMLIVEVSFGLIANIFLCMLYIYDNIDF